MNVQIHQRQPDEVPFRDNVPQLDHRVPKTNAYFNQMSSLFEIITFN